MMSQIKFMWPAAAHTEHDYHRYMCAARAAVPLVFALIIGLAAADVRAAHDEGKNRLYADELVEQVLTLNAGLAALRAAVDAAAARVAPAGALPDPQLRVTTAPRTFDGFTTPDGRKRGISGVIEFSQDVPWPGTLGVRKDVARREAAAVSDNVAALRLRLEAATRSQYAQWVYAHKALEINAANQELVDELRRVAENRYATGLARQQDVLQAEVELQRLKTQKFTFERLQTVMRARINALLNRDAGHALAAPADFNKPQAIPAYPQLRDRALTNHPELAALNQRIAANQGRENLANKAFFPDLRLIARNNDYRPASETRSEIGISINLPLDRDKRRAALNAATANTMRMRYELEDARARLLGDLAQARAQALQAAKTITLYQNELIPRTLENLSAARSEYGAGGGSFSDVITAEQIKLTAELELESARADYSSALADLTRWTGGELPSASSAFATAITPRVSHEKF